MNKRMVSVTKLLVIVILVVAFGWLALSGMQIGRYNVLPITEAISQGLDLRGGVYAIYEADDTGIEDFAEKLSGAIEVLRNRLDAQGYTEATITLQGSDRIRVEIPDVDDPNAVLDIIGTPALLQFVDPTGEVIMEGDSIEFAQAGFLDTVTPVVSFELNNEGTKLFADATTEYVGEIIKIQLDGVDISTPEVQSPILGGEGYIEGMGSIEEAQELAMLIQSGALPLEIEQLEIRTVSATLGEDALQTSILAGLIGISVLLIFLALYYKLPGLVADLALIIYIVIVLYLLAVIPGVQLTLPGIAGIILGIGMAVDANVIIFERFKEELRTGKSLRASIESAFKKAFVTILDANITTVIAAIVLIIFGTGPIKGFGITLTIGICASMFTAVVITRYLMRLVVRMNITDIKFYEWKSAKKEEVE